MKEDEVCRGIRYGAQFLEGPVLKYGAPFTNQQVPDEMQIAPGELHPSWESPYVVPEEHNDSSIPAGMSYIQWLEAGFGEGYVAKLRKEIVEEMIQKLIAISSAQRP